MNGNMEYNMSFDEALNGDMQLEYFGRLDHPFISAIKLCLAANGGTLRSADEQLGWCIIEINSDRIQSSDGSTAQRQMLDSAKNLSELLKEKFSFLNPASRVKSGSYFGDSPTVILLVKKDVLDKNLDTVKKITL